MTTFSAASETVSIRTQALTRMLAVAGFISAAILIVNAAKRAGVLPISPVTQLIAPIAQLAAIGFVIGIYIATAKTIGRLGLIGVSLSVASLGGLLGVEFVLNLVFPYLGEATITQLRGGPLGVALTVASVSFLVSTVIFMAALWKVKSSPKVALALYAVSAMPISLRTAFPEVVLQLALVGLAVAIAWLAVWVLMRVRDASA